MFSSIQQHPFLIAGLFLTWLLSYFFIWPVGDFSCIDSWYYAFPVRSLLYEGKFLLPHLTGPNTYVQVGLGYILCLFLKNFSFDYLRILTVIISFSGSWCFYLLIRPHLDSSKLLGIALAIFIFHPLYFLLSFTFMTDIYFCVLALWSCWAFKEYLCRSHQKYFYLFLLFSSLCFLNRQIGLFLFPAAFLVFQIKGERPIFSITLLILPIILFLGIEKIIKPGLGITAFDYNIIGILGDKLLSPEWKDIQSVTKRGMATFLLLGYFLIPLGILVFRQTLGKFSIRNKGILLILLVVGTYLGSFGNVFSPDRGNMFYNLGLGPQLLKDIFMEKQFTDTIHLGIWFEYLAIFLGLLSSFALLIFFWKKGKERGLNGFFTMFLLLFNLLVIPFSLLFHFFFDRYLLFPIISLMIIFWMAYEKEKINFWKQAVFPLILTVSVGFSLLATKDYFTWQKAKANAYSYLSDQNISIKKIDAGFEINGWKNAYLGYQQKEGKSWWFVDEDEYCLSFGPIEGYEVIHREPYFRFLTLKTQDILILKK